MRERGFGNLLGDFGPPWTESTEFWARGGRRLLNSDKEFALTMGADAESLKAGAGDGEGCKGRREGEKQLPRQHTQVNS